MCAATGRCLGGSAKSVDPIPALMDMLPRQWKPDGPLFRPIRAPAKERSATLHSDWEASSKLCERGLIDAAAEMIGRLASSQGEIVLGVSAQ